MGLVQLARALRALLPAGEAPTLKSKYVQVGINQFKNDYLREVVEKRPQYNDYLRVYIGDGEIISNKIEHVPDEVGRPVVKLDDVFEKQTRQQEFYEIIKKPHMGEAEGQD